MNTFSLICKDVIFSTFFFGVLKFLFNSNTNVTFLKKKYRIGLMDKPICILKMTCLLWLLDKLNERLLVELSFVSY